MITEKTPYVGFSNYREYNQEDRIKSFEDEARLWGDDYEKYLSYRWEWKDAVYKNYVPDRPLNVSIDPSSACNFKCVFCHQSLPNFHKKTGMMTLQHAKHLIDQVAEMNCPSVKFTSVGEPTLNKDLPEMIRYAKEKGILEVSMNTNASDPHNILKTCCWYGIDRIIFSLDGHTKEVYENLRRGGVFEEVVGNIMRVVNWKKKRRSVRPFLRIQFVRTKTNAHQVDDFLAHWKQIVSDVRISDVMARGTSGDWSVGDQKIIGRARCPQPFVRMIVSDNMQVVPCCSDVSREYVIGDASKERLIEIWNNAKMRYMRKIQNDVTLDKIGICKKCFVKESYIFSNGI